jgi:hypothetical protein
MELDPQIALRMANARIHEAVRRAEQWRDARDTRAASLRRRLGTALVWLGHRMQE